MTEIDSIEKHESPEHQVNEIWFLKQTAVLRFWLAINISVFDFVAIKPEQEVYITTLSHLHFFIRLKKLLICTTKAESSIVV